MEEGECGEDDDGLSLIKDGFFFFFSVFGLKGHIWNISIKKWLFVCVMVTVTSHGFFSEPIPTSALTLHYTFVFINFFLWCWVSVY